MHDLGYDLSDYREIDPTFGTLDDFGTLMAACRDRALEGLLDLVRPRPTTACAANNRDITLLLPREGQQGQAASRETLLVVPSGPSNARTSKA